MSPEAGLVWLSLGAVYLAPAGLAYWWRHPSRHAIAAVNLFLGWTLLGWLAAAYWAGRKRCPFCAEFIKPMARVCPRCTRNLPA